MRDHEFIEILEKTSLEHGNIEKILNIFTDFTSITAAYIENYEKKHYISGGADYFSSNIRLYPMEELMRLYIHFPVIHCNSPLGMLILNSSPNSSFASNYLLPHLANAIIICSLFNKKDNTSITCDQAILDILLHGTKDEINACKNYMKQRRFTLDGTFCAVVVYVKQKYVLTNDSIMAELSQEMRGLAQCFAIPFIMVNKKNLITFDFMVSDEDILKAIIDNFHEVAIRYNHKYGTNSMYIGVGSHITGFENYYISWNEAIDSIKYFLFNNIRIILCYWHDIGINRNLAYAAHDNTCYKHVEAMLKPLMEYDRSHSVGLFITLVAFVLNHWNLTATAKLMFLHYNSVKYRYKSICSILKLDMNSQEVRFCLSIAIRTYVFAQSINECESIITNINTMHL